MVVMEVMLLWCWWFVLVGFVSGEGVGLAVFYVLVVFARLWSRVSCVLKCCVVVVVMCVALS